MEPEIFMPAPLIKEEDISEDVIIDLDNYRSIEDITDEWEIKIFEKFKFFFIPDGNNLTKLMNWYIKSLKQDALDILNDDALKSYILRHINFFKTHFVEMRGSFVDSYLDNLEEILTVYCDLEVKLLPKKVNNSKNYVKHYKRRIGSIMHQIVVLAKHCLLYREDRLLHVFMRMNVNKVSEEARIFFNLLFRKFLTVIPKDKSDLAFCRAYILCQKWKKIMDEVEWPKMDKMVYTAFNKTAVSVNSNETLRSILLPHNDSVLDLITHRSNDPTVLCEAYFKYIGSETFNGLDDVTQPATSDSDDEEFLPVDSQDEVDELAFVKAYNTYVDSIKPINTFYKDQDEVVDQEDSDCCIVSVGTCDVNPNDTQMVHELPNDDDILEIIYFVKKDSPPTRKKKNLNKTLDSNQSTPETASTIVDHSPVVMKTSPLHSTNKQGVTLGTQTEVGLTCDSRQEEQEDSNKRFYEVLTPPSDQNIEENISELSVYTDIVTRHATDHLTEQDKSMETTFIVSDDEMFESDHLESVRDFHVNNSVSCGSTVDTVGNLSLDIPSPTSNSVQSHRLSSNGNISDIQSYGQQSESYISSSLSNCKEQINGTKNITKEGDLVSDKFLDNINVNSDDNYTEKEVQPPTEKQTDPNILFDTREVQSNSPTLSKNIVSTPRFTEHTSHTAKAKQAEETHANKIIENVQISNSVLSTLTQAVTIETQTESNFNFKSQEGRQENVNKDLYGILTPPSDQNMDENITKVSVYTKIVNPNIINRKDSQKYCKDNSTVENEDSSVKIIQNYALNENSGISSLVSHKKSRLPQYSSNKIISDVTGCLQQFESYTNSLLDNINNHNKNTHNLVNVAAESSVKSTVLENNQKKKEVIDLEFSVYTKIVNSKNTNQKDLQGQYKNNLSNGNKNSSIACIESFSMDGYSSSGSPPSLDNTENQNHVDEVSEENSVRNIELNNCEPEELANRIIERNDETFEKPKTLKLKELKVAIPNMDLIFTTKKEKINNDSEKKIMFTSPLKVTRAGLADFCNFEDTLHKKWQQIRENNTLDDFLCGPVEKLNGVTSCLNLDKSYDLFENTDSEAATSNATPNTTPTTCSTELTSPAYEEGLDDFRNFYDEKKNRDSVAATISSSPSPDRSQKRKRPSQDFEEDTSHKSVLDTEPVSNPIKRTRIAIDEIVREHPPSTIETALANLNPKNTPKGILKKFSTTYLEAKRNTTNILIPRSKMCLASLDYYSVSPTDHQLQSVVCVVLERISKQEIAQWLRVSEIARKVRKEKEGYNWYMYECLNFKKPGSSKLKNNISCEIMPGTSSSSIVNRSITQWRNPPGIFPSSSSVPNTVGLPAVSHHSTSETSKGMVDDTALTTVNHNFNNLLAICNGSCCQPIAEDISHLQISTPKIHSTFTSLSRNPFQKTENGTDKINFDYQENDAVIKFVPDSNVLLPDANAIADLHGNLTKEPILESYDIPILQSNEFRSTQLAHNQIKSAGNSIAQHADDPILPSPDDPIQESFAKPIAQPAIVPELGEFEKILNMKTSTISLDLQNLDLRRLSPSPVSSSSSTEKSFPNSASLLNEELDPQGKVERFLSDSPIPSAEFIESIGGISEISYDEDSYFVAVDTPLHINSDKPIEDNSNNDSAALLSSNILNDKTLVNKQSIKQSVNISLNSLSKSTLQNIDKVESLNKGIEKHGQINQNYTIAETTSNRACDISQWNNQNLNRSEEDILLNRIGEKYFQSDYSYKTKKSEKLLHYEQNNRMAVDKSLITVSDKLFQKEKCYKNSKKASEQPLQVKSSYEQIFEIPLNQVCKKQIKGRYNTATDDNRSEDIRLNRISEECVKDKHNYEIADNILLNRVSERPLQCEKICNTAMEITQNKVAGNHLHHDKSCNAFVEISSNRLHEKGRKDQQNYNKAETVVLNSVYENSYQNEQSRTIAMEIKPNRFCGNSLQSEQTYNRVQNILMKKRSETSLLNYKLPMDKLCEQSYQRPVEVPSSSEQHSNRSLDISLNSVWERPLQGEQCYPTAMDMPINKIYEKTLSNEKNYDKAAEKSLNNVSEKHHHGRQMEIRNRLSANSLQQKHSCNTIMELPSNKVNEKAHESQHCGNISIDVPLNRVCEIPIDVGQSYNTTTNMSFNRNCEKPFQDMTNLNRTEGIQLNKVFEQSYDKTQEIPPNRISQKTIQDEDIYRKVVDTPLLGICDKNFQNVQNSDTTVHIPLNRINNIPLHNSYNTEVDMASNKTSKRLSQNKQNFNTISASLAKIENSEFIQDETNYNTTSKVLSNENSTREDDPDNTVRNMSLNRNFDITDTTNRTDYKFMDFNEIDTRLPLKKRKHSVANCTDEESDDDFLDPDLIEDIIKRARSEELQKDDISYPAKPMISIAEVQEKLTENQQPKVFRTPAEKKEMPPPPPPPAAQVNFLETPKIITEQYNNHTYNNPTINYHMNNVPYTFFSCASIPYFPPIIVPMGGTTTFDMNLMPTPQQHLQQHQQHQQQHHQAQTANTSNGVHQSNSTQGATAHTRRDRKTKEDRVKTDGH